MKEVFVLRHPGWTCFSHKHESGFVSGGGDGCVVYSDTAAGMAREVWSHAATPYPREALIAKLVANGCAEASCKAVIETLQRENILLVGLEEVLSKTLSPASAVRPICEHLLVCMTGALQSANFYPYLRALKSAFCIDLKIILTEPARKLVQPKALLHILCSDIYCDIYEDTIETYNAPHIWLSEWASCVLVAPASAATIHRIAHGSCDDLVSLTVAATPPETPVVIGPCMNSRMWQNEAVQANVVLCRNRGYWIIEPGYGFEASKYREEHDGPRVGALGAQPGTLVELMAQIVRRQLPQ
ncbi:MAG: hypothetical protein HYX92_22105 [Chloroflexi bacterium]|nr:hypothetical protein [Chloroflexota bacterium]